jgi:hypothetical protein
MTSQTVGEPGVTDGDLSIEQQVKEQDTSAQASPDQSPAGDEAEPEAVSRGVVFDILRNRRRRNVLKYLDEQGGNATLGEVSERLAAIENDKPEAQITSQERKRLYVGLYQCHLPRMDDAGAIDFNSDRGVIEASEHMPAFLDPLASDDENKHDRRWPIYYLTIAGLAAGLFVLEMSGALATQLLPGTTVLLAGVIAAVGLGSIVHWATSTRATDADEDGEAN